MDQALWQVLDTTRVEKTWKNVSGNEDAGSRLRIIGDRTGVEVGPKIQGLRGQLMPLQPRRPWKRL